MNNTTEHDYVTEAVSAEGRRSAFPLFFVILGFVLVVGMMFVGGAMAPQMSRGDLINAVLIGNLVLAAAAFFSGYIGAESGKSFNLLMSEAFPGISWKIASLFVPIVMIGWYSIESALFANYVAEVLKLTGVGHTALMVGSALLFSTTAYFGIRFIGYISYLLVPIILILGYFAITYIAGNQTAAFGFGQTQLGLTGGIATVVSSWILAALVCIPDITRFSKSPMSGAVVASTALFIGNCFNLFIGAAGAALTKQYDPALILASLGFIPLGLLFSFANIWTTNDNNLYAAALHVARLANMPRRKAVVYCVIIGAFIAAFNPANLPFIFSVLLFMGSTGPALGGVVLGRYVVRYWAKRPGSESALAAWLGWILGSTVAFNVGGILTVPLGFIIGFLVWWTVSSLAKNKTPEPELAKV